MPKSWPDAAPDRVEDLSEALLARDAARRQQAERDLLAIGSPAIEPLVLLASQPDRVQGSAIRILLPKFGPEHVWDLAKAAQLRDQPVREVAIEAVAAMGEAALAEVRKLIDTKGPSGDFADRPFPIAVLRRQGALGELLRLLKHPDPAVAASIRFVLASARDTRSKDALDVPKSVEEMSRALVEPDAGKRMQAEQDLLAIGAPAIAPLLRLASLPSTAQRYAIRDFLAKLGPERVFDFAQAGQWGAERDLAIEIVAAMGEPAWPEIRKLIDPRPLAPNGHSWFVISVLRKQDAIGELLALLKHRDPEAAGRVASLFANIPDPRSKDALLEVLNSSSINVRTNAALGLGKLHDRRAIEPLLEMLRKDPRFEAREAAASALGRLYEPRLLAPLAASARSGEPHVRRAAAYALEARSGEPVATRLGRRYAVRPLDPADRGTVVMIHALWLTVTGLLFHLTLVIGANRGGPAWQGFPQGVWRAAVALALWGIVWGRVVTGISANVEYALWLLCIPTAAWVAWWSGPILRPAIQVVKDLAIILLLGVVLAFFFGYYWEAVGWLPPGAVVLSVLSTAAGAPRTRWAGDGSTLVSFHKAIGLGAASFYVGYVIGWLALWGYFGV